LDEPEQIIFFSIFKGKTVQRCPGNDMVHGRDVRTDKSSYSGHLKPPDVKIQGKCKSSR
jgi:hypothetical protein